MGAQYDVLCYGAISLDVSGRVETPWSAGEHHSASDYRLSPGGDATLVALTLAGLGMRVALAGGPIGDDPPGDYLRDILTSAGIGLYVDTRGKTSISAVAVTPSGERSSITYHEATPVEQIPVPVDLVPRVRYVYADGCYRGNDAVAGAAAKEAGVPALLNLDGPELDAAGLFDAVVASATVARLISPDPLAAAETIRARGAGLAIVTMGERGCICSDGGLLAVPAYRVEAVDTTGAGAAFTAGFLYARLQDFNILDSLRIASAAGAYKCLARGSYRQFDAKALFDFIGSVE
ncbi:MAG: putative sugar kinase [Methanocella sp. PtaU1.Bin125]|nr:MAG: putative sugar kinase [Methanocella sp. PtaU1.Bin125]